MLSPTHLAGGFIALSAAKPAIDFYVDPGTSRKLIVVGLLLSLLIDLDGLWIANPNHHISLLHYPLFWLGVSITTFIGGVLLQSGTLKALAIVIAVASFTHLLLDTFGVTMGIFWLWPVSMQEFSFLQLHPIFENLVDWFLFYIKQPIMLLEAAIVVAALLLFLVQRRAQKSDDIDNVPVGS